MIIVSGTGHRPPKLGGYSDDVFWCLVDMAKDWLVRIQEELNDKVVEVVSGMALGWDQALAQAAIELGIPLVAAIPCEGQESRWPPESRARYNSILSKATRVELVSKGVYHPAKMQRRNEWMVDRGTHIAAVWDGSGGGTRNCLRYADKQEKPVYNLWDLWVDKYRPREEVQE